MLTRKNVTQSTIDAMCKEHELWLAKKKGGKKAVFNNMRNARPLSFCGKSLSQAEFINCVFTNCNFDDADLRHAVMSSGDYRWSKFRGASMDNANFSGSDLSLVIMQNSGCSEANFENVKLCSADLVSTNLKDANFSGADLRRANLLDAKLDGAILTNAKMPPLRLPSSGQFRAFKKVFDNTTIRNVVLELVVSGKKPRTASYVGNKCRCQKAKVVAAYGMDGKKLNHKNGCKYQSMHKLGFVYTLGDWIEEPNYDGDPRVECTRGIHFFMTKEEALAYG